MRGSNQSGFTIVELMISTVIFSMILLMLTSGVISFTRSYYKGITETNTQRIARTITDDITQTIQSTSLDFTQLPIDANGVHGFCIGNIGYSYILGYQLIESAPDISKHQTSHSLIKGNVAGGCSSYNKLNGPTLYSYLTSQSTSEEMLAPSMRLAKLDVSSVPKNSIGTGIYSVSINVVYGDDDLLTNPTSSDPSCVSDSGSQFCAVSGLSTVVQKRIQQ